MAASQGQSLPMVEPMVMVGLPLGLVFIIARQHTVCEGPSNLGIEQGPHLIYNSFTCLRQGNGDLHPKLEVIQLDLVPATVPWNTLLLVLIPDLGQGLGHRQGSDPYRPHPNPATRKHVPRHCQPHLLMVSRLI